jgi:hypothetical protein
MPEEKSFSWRSSHAIESNVFVQEGSKGQHYFAQEGAKVNIIFLSRLLLEGA